MKRALIILLFLAGLAGAGAWFYFNRPKDGFSYGTPHELEQIQQTDPNAVLADALTWRREAQNDWLTLKVRISFKLKDDAFWVAFAGVRTQSFVFRREFVDTLLRTLDRFDDLSSRLRQQDRTSYSDLLGTVSIYDHTGRAVPVPVHFVVTPRFVTFQKEPFAGSPSGQAYLMTISLPFPLEQAEPFERTEVRIDEAGLRQLRKLLNDFRRQNEQHFI